MVTQLKRGQFGCDNYRILPKTTDNFPKTKLLKTNPNAIPSPNPKPLTMNPINVLKPYTIIITEFSASYRYW